jgi:hypothetical protein
LGTADCSYLSFPGKSRTPLVCTAFPLVALPRTSPLFFQRIQTMLPCAFSSPAMLREHVLSMRV